jgi:cytochrome c553
MWKFPRPFLVAALMPAAVAHAAASPPPARLGLCATCHGRNGVAQIPGAPNLAGEPYQYLLQALHEYRTGQRDVPVMRAAAGPLSRREIEALARWYSMQSPCRTASAARP